MPERSREVIVKDGINLEVNPVEKPPEDVLVARKELLARARMNTAIQMEPFNFTLQEVTWLNTIAVDGDIF